MELNPADSSTPKVLDVGALLGTNQYVPDIHHKGILAQVKTLDTELETMDQEISQLKARLFAEEKHREEKWRTRQAYAGLISPMRRLPTELLSKVLQDVLDCPRMLSSEDIPRLNSLHLVCRRWRDVVRSTPRHMDLPFSHTSSATESTTDRRAEEKTELDL
ncbi:hypothetical protein BKA70DRAFT_1435232 [Coprinopsis sp. MPI-PUGE-AT-0042]|nr:hypothetical protein BKA70DRAFT_1435232 [Coprinopsis sp. MPI-PUGE-AT-0042]